MMGHFTGLHSKIIAFCLMIATLTLTPSLSQADRESRADNIILATASDFPPFTDLNSPIGGMSTLMVVRPFEEGGINVQEISRVSWKRAFQDTGTLEHDATFPWVETEERKEDYLFSNAMQTVPLYAWVSTFGDFQPQTNEAMFSDACQRPSGFY